jgi:hypothetical protein
MLYDSDNYFIEIPTKRARLNNYFYDNTIITMSEQVHNNDKHNWAIFDGRKKEVAMETNEDDEFFTHTKRDLIVMHQVCCILLKSSIHYCSLLQIHENS